MAININGIPTRGVTGIFAHEIIDHGKTVQCTITKRAGRWRDGQWYYVKTLKVKGYIDVVQIQDDDYQNWYWHSYGVHENDPPDLYTHRTPVNVDVGNFKISNFIPFYDKAGNKVENHPYLNLSTKETHDVNLSHML